MSPLVAELGDELARDSLEALGIVRRHLLLPAPPGGRWLYEAVVIGQARGALTSVIAEHLGIELQLEDPAHHPQRRLRVGDEVLVAQLEITARAQLATEASRAADLAPPLRRERGQAAGAGPVEAWATAHLDEREPSVAAVPHEVDVLGIRKRTLDDVEPLHVGRGLVAEARLPARVRIRLVDGPDRVGEGRPVWYPFMHSRRRHSPPLDAREPADVAHELVGVRPLAVSIPELRDEVRLGRDRQARVPIEHLLQQRGAAARDAEDDYGDVAQLCPRDTQPAGCQRGLTGFQSPVERGFRRFGYSRQSAGALVLPARETTATAALRSLACPKRPQLPGRPARHPHESASPDTGRCGDRGLQPDRFDARLRRRRTRRRIAFRARRSPRSRGAVRRPGGGVLPCLLSL